MRGACRALRLAGILSLFLAPGSVFAGGIFVPVYSLDLTDKVLDVGFIGHVDVLLDNYTFDLIEAYQLAVCHDPSLATIYDVDAGPAVLALDPDFYMTYFYPDRWAAAAVFSFTGSSGLGFGADQVIQRAWYQVIDHGTQQLCFCDFEQPPGVIQDTLLVVDGSSFTPMSYCGSLGTATILIVRGDANFDGIYDVADAIFTLSDLFGDGAPSPCDDSADANDDGFVDIGDPVFTLSYFFTDGPAPILGCHADATPDDLGCVVATGGGGCP